MKRDVLNAPRLNELKRRRRRRRMSKIFLAFLGIVTFFASLAYLSGLTRLNISKVEIVGNKVLDVAVLEALVNEQTSGKYFWLLPKTNILFYPKNAIQNELQKTFKRIKEIDLAIKENNTLEISINEQVALYTWCGYVTQSLNSNSNQKCYFMDSEGYIFDEAPYFSPGVYFKFYGDENVNLENPSGIYFLKDKFAKIIVLKNRIEEFGLQPSSFWLNNLGDASFFLSPKEELGPEIIFKIDSDLEKVAENLHAALSTEPLKSKLKNKSESLEYIDLRFGNKVYNKFK